jgi:hypothetical protein
VGLRPGRFSLGDQSVVARSLGDHSVVARSVGGDSANGVGFGLRRVNLVLVGDADLRVRGDSNGAQPGGQLNNERAPVRPRHLGLQRIG